MCEFCDWIRDAETEGDFSKKYIRRWERSGIFDLFLGNGGIWDSGELRDIKYCPMCGRKLTEENKVEMKPVIRAHAIIDWLGNTKCSNCGNIDINVTEPYCQHCGARLDEPEERKE